ncbi:hypothetical protein OH77DRAFT_891100 [Trametes cingulata]|nr:hypothetical protein OH77DRAFT_891100 [Trametes cingulata]
MHIAAPHLRVRQADIPGFSGAATVSSTPVDTALAFDTSAATIHISASAPPLAPNQQITLTSSAPPTSTPVPTTSASAAADVSSAASKGHQIPLGTVIAICVGAFIGVVAIICLVYAWFRRSTDKLSAAARRNAEGEAEQQRTRGKDFNKLSDSEKPRGGNAPPPSPGAREHLPDSDEKNFSMFKKSTPSVRTAYTAKTTTDEDQLMDLPKLDFTKYHPSLAQELALEHPDKPFAARQESGVSWDGETLGDDSFLSMRSVRVESGTMSPTMVMAKMTPPATASAIHRWESAEVLNADEDHDHAQASQSRNPFAEMAEERRSRNNPFFNAQEMNRNSRAIRSRSNSRASRTSRAQSLVRPESRVTMPNTNPFLDMQDSLPVSATESHTPEALLSPTAGLPLKPSVASGASAQAFGNERAMASLIAALDLSKEEVEERLRVVSMQGSTISAYSENDESDIATVREFPLPPGTTAHSP